MNTFTLKLIATVTMLIDHLGAVIFKDYEIFRIVGRISFPIFCFLLVEGFFYTKNVYKYLGRLLLFAVISEPLYDRLFYGEWIYAKRGNVYITLVVGLIFMMICSKMNNMVEKSIVFVVFLMCASYIPMDYGMYGIAMIGGFYLLRDRRISNIIYQGLINVWIMRGIQAYGIIGATLTTFYNGKKGCSRFKYAFYILYPLHLGILLIIQFLK